MVLYAPNYRVRQISGVSLFALGLVYASVAQAAPTGGVVSAGSAQIHAAGGAVDVTQSSTRAVIDWDSFNLDRNEAVRFNQLNSQSVILNRIHDANPSHIQGKIQANGHVVLVNPNGVLFSRTAQVDVAGLVVSTADTGNDRFMQGDDLQLDRPGNPDASIINEGAITASEAGIVALVAPHIRNSGIITAKLGKVHLASGDTATIDLYGDGLIQVAASDKVTKQLIENDGTITAAGGYVNITAAAGEQITDSLINMQGIISADSVEKAGGTIILHGNGDKGVLSLSGRLSATAAEPGGKGGKIEATSHTLVLTNQAALDVSGAAGGGTIHVGGEFHGQGNLKTANKTLVQEHATLKANALQKGNGGDVVVWADDATDFAGTIESKGGSMGGNGGNAEVSGKNWLNYHGLADLRGNNGSDGSLLLDPTNITITTTDSSPALNWSGSVFSDSVSNRTSANLSVTTLQNQLALSDVTISTASAGGGTGNITVSSAITWNSNHNLTLTADNFVSIGSNITYTGNSNVQLNVKAKDHIYQNADLTVDTAGGATGSMKVTLNSDSDASGAGSVRLNTNADIITNGADIIIGGGLNPQTDYAVGNATYDDGITLLGNNMVNAGGGTIYMNGQGRSNAGSTSLYGIYIDSGSQIKTTGSGSISMYGKGGNGDSSLYGVRFQNASIAEVQNGSITIWGQGGVAAIGSSVNGILLNTGSQIRSTATSTTAGTIHLTGLGGSTPTSSQEGVMIKDTNTKVSSGYANIIIDGTGGSGAGNLARGVDVYSGGRVESTGTGTHAASIQVTGIAGSGVGDYYEGVLIQDQASALGAGITSIDGNITLQGTGGASAAAAAGVSFDTSGGTASSSAFAYATGSGNLTLISLGRGIKSGGSSTMTVGSMSGTGTVSLISDALVFAGPYSINSGGDLVLRPYNANTTVGVGSAVTGSTTFDLTDTLLSNLSWGGTLWLGGANNWNQSGTTSVNVTRNFNGNVNILSGADIAMSGGVLSKTAGATSANWKFLANNGITTSGSADITASSGNIHLTMDADYDQNNTGLLTIGAGSDFALGAGDAILAGQDFSLSGTASIQTTGNATVKPSASGTTMGIGSGTGSFAVSDAELGRFTGAMSSLTLGSATTGNLAINSGYLFSRPTLFRTGATATLAGQISGSSAGTALQVIAGTAINNSYGSGVFNLTGGGRFLTWSVNPATDTGEEYFANSNTPHYGRNYGDVVSETGSVRNYSFVPQLTITATGSATYGDSAPATSYIASGWLTGEQALDSLTGAPSYNISGYSTTTHAGNSFTITPSQNSLSSALGYGFTMAAASPTISKRNITATVGNQSRQYGNANPTLSWSDVTWNGLQNSETGAVLDTVGLSYAGTTNSTAHAGTSHAISLSLTDNDYNLTSFTAGSLSIAKKDITATVSNQSRQYGDANPTLSWSDVTWNGLQNSETGAVLDTVGLSYAGTANATAHAGTSHAISLSLTDNDYNLTSFTAGSLSIAKKDITATVGNQSRQYGDANPTLSWSDVTWNGLQNSETGAVLDTVGLSYAGTANATAHAGTNHAISLSLTDNNYNLTGYTAGSLSIALANLVISANSPSIMPGDTPLYTAGYNGFRNGQNAGILLQAPSFSDNAPDYNTPGHYTVTGYGASAADYQISYLNGILTIIGNNTNNTGNNAGNNTGNNNSGNNIRPANGLVQKMENRFTNIHSDYHAIRSPENGDNHTNPGLASQQTGFNTSNPLQGGYYLYDRNSSKVIFTTDPHITFTEELLKILKLSISDKI